MILPILLVLPLVAAFWALAAPRRGPQAGLGGAALSGAGLLLALALARQCLAQGEVGFGAGRFLRADALSAIMVLVVSGVAFVAIGCGRSEMSRARSDGAVDESVVRRYHALTQLFVFTMLLTVLANNVGVMWVALESTTIVTAFLIGLRGSKAALEASWKYILIGSIGIALAFLGTVLAYFNFVQRVGEMPFALHWTVLARVAPGLDPDVLRLAFVFILVGYGTKVGLAPMHTWLPDAHSEAPAPISAMMSGALLAVALYAILRWKVVVDACVGSLFSERLLLLIGTGSVVLAAILLAGQTSYKRMLAYSSVEHMGLCCLGLALGPMGTLAALLHIMTHAASKSMLFVVAGDIATGYRSAAIGAVRGLARSLPRTGGLFLVGMLALLGLPPFGLFVSEFMLFRAGFLTGHPWVTGFNLALLVWVFVSLLGVTQKMCYGPPAPGEPPTQPSILSRAPLLLNLAVLLGLGVAIPPPLLALVRQAMEIVHS